MAVWYPASSIFDPSPVIDRGTPAYPESGSAGFEISIAALRTLTWMGLRPDCTADLQSRAGPFNERKTFDECHCDVEL